MSTRNLYLKTVSVEEAYEIYQNALSKLTALDTELIDVYDSIGRLTSRAVYAVCNSPLYNAAAMDGICVESLKTKNASEENPLILKLGTDFKIVDTGDAIKPPYDAVIMAEDCIQIDENNIKINSPASGWENIRPIGEDIASGDMILPSNHKITPIDIGALIAGGIKSIECYKTKTVGIIPTGDEIVDLNDNLKEGDIVDSNSYMIKSLVEDLGGIGKRYDIVEDDYDKIKSKLLESINANDITIINAGSSAGTEDYTVHILREIGEVFVHGVSIKPGKPVILAIVNNKPVVGLPGYPLSAYINFNLFVKPLLFHVHDNGEEVDAIISKRIVSSLKYREYVRVKIGKIDGKYIASPLNRGAASQMSMVRADGILVIPQNQEGIEAGSISKVRILNKNTNLSNTLLSIGSHDILMDIASDIMSRKYEDVSLSSTHVGSMGGLIALKRNETIIAPIHLLDEISGEYNISIIKEMFGEGKVSLIKGFDRIQGIMVKKNNPCNIKSIEDIVKHRFVNRQKGAGTRVLLDYKLKLLNIDPSSIDGYEKEVSTHTAVAASVASPYIDCGLGVKSAADNMGLDFIEVGIEEYDFAVLTKNLEDPKVKKFIDVIKSTELKTRLDKLGGYSYSHLGNIINI